MCDAGWADTTRDRLNFISCLVWIDAHTYYYPTPSSARHKLCIEDSLGLIIYLF
jgi:hypothetical protein